MFLFNSEQQSDQDERGEWKFVESVNQFDVIGAESISVSDGEQDEVGTGPDTVSLAFLMSLGVAFGVLIVVMVVMAAYLTFCQGNEDEEEYNEESGLLPRNFFKKSAGVLLDSSLLMQGSGSSDDLTEVERQQLTKMSRFEIELYQRAKEFRMMNPPMVKPFGTYVNASDRQCIKDRGIQAYYLLPSINDNVDVSGNFLPSFLIQDKLNITFTKYNKSSSTIMNYPLPFNKRDAVYFEVKVYKFKNTFMSNSIFSIGLVTCPYPYFSMPGMCPYSIAYESTGKLRINNAFYASTLLPSLQEGDVVGVGYRYRSGTIFITHNGKKLMDLTHNVGIDLFIGIGAMNAAYTRTYTKNGLLDDIDNVELRNELADVELGQKKEISDVINEQLLLVHDPQEACVDSDEIELHVNLGNLGYVFVEANVKKYSFGSLFGDIGIPPAYNGDETKTDLILQKGDDLPPTYPEDELGFFGNIKVNLGHRPSTSVSTISNNLQGSSESFPGMLSYERNTSTTTTHFKTLGEEMNNGRNLPGDITENEAAAAAPLLSRGSKGSKSAVRKKRRKMKNQK
ncbi:Ssh4p Ecym_2472 [Eremothecium cymbalariae DBVPG|uniref:B30.2/SPRY domain-containing protein n=1 Tax=Eremothecium cymbalariae (strain CBS 270.75 / DBVPG 7215 / KCTC 17166 / NRRL Y-17582) TaxID=931890 RepID=G8JPT9_ERECY|nr:Hypothetical protein Ecym_2472 [Eremothecium cymbalariae DBVPG\